MTQLTSPKALAAEKIAAALTVNEDPSECLADKADDERNILKQTNFTEAEVEKYFRKFSASDSIPNKVYAL